MNENTIRLQEEMMLRGFQAILEEKGPHREYAAAYDAFLEEHDLTERIGNKPENIQEAFGDIVTNSPSSPTRRNHD